MPTSDYRLKDGSKVPGVTTVCGQLGWSKGALMYWAWDQGRNGKDFRDTRDAAANSGTVAHAMIDAEIRGRKFNPDGISKDLLNKAETAYLNFLEWSKRNELKVSATEIPMISEKWRFGGTPDCIAYIGGKLSLLDWKTGSGLYEDHLIQLAAYKELWEENYPDALIQGGFDLLRISKEEAGFTHYHRDALPGCFDAFLHLRELYDIKGRLKGLK